MSDDQLPTAKAMRQRSARRRTSPAAKSTDQPLVPPVPPMTHEGEAWSQFRETWEVYAAQRRRSEPGVSQAEAEHYQEAWEGHWVALGQPWRREPEITEQRQSFLAGRRRIQADWRRGIFPFKDIPLSRADLEWLLATHQDGQWLSGQWTPSLFTHASGMARMGLDLRGADLRYQNLHRMPLAYLNASLSAQEWYAATPEQREAAAIHLEGARLDVANLRGARLRNAFMQGVDLDHANMCEVIMQSAHLGSWTIPDQDSSRLGRWKRGSHFPSTLPPADMRNAFFDEASDLWEVDLGDGAYGTPLVVDVQWGGVNLTVIDWSRIVRLGDEYKARRPRKLNQTLKLPAERLGEYQQAIRAYRQLALALRAQGINEVADRFAYRAQSLQRSLLWQSLWWDPAMPQHEGMSVSSKRGVLWIRNVGKLLQQLGAYLFSLVLEVLAGYGYRPGRALGWYLVVTIGFALGYAALGHLPFFPDACVLSLTSFHGRGFFPGLGTTPSLHNPLVVVAALEAVIGLFIEISFIATFTQRFFGR